MSNTSAVFTRDQLIRSIEFRDQRDLIAALLEPDKTYTKAEAKRLLRNYLKGTVK